VCSGLPALLFSIFVPACCRGQSCSATRPIVFQLKTIPFRLENGVTPAKNIPETMLGGIAIFDYNGDGRPDIFFTKGLYKSFRISESKLVQFRVQATNWLNHPLPQFGLAGTSDEMINLQQTNSESIPSTAVGPDGPICSALGLTVANGACTYNYNSIAPSNTNDTLTGKPNFKTGQRVLTFAVKFYF
jgi:hypothetical protein